MVVRHTGMLFMPGSSIARTATTHPTSSHNEGQHLSMLDQQMLFRIYDSILDPKPLGSRISQGMRCSREVGLVFEDNFQMLHARRLEPGLRVRGSQPSLKKSR